MLLSFFSIPYIPRYFQFLNGDSHSLFSCLTVALHLKISITHYSLYIHLSLLLHRLLIEFNRGHSNYFATSQNNWSSAEGIVLKNHMNTANIVFRFYNQSNYICINFSRLELTIKTLGKDWDTKMKNKVGKCIEGNGTYVKKSVTLLRSYSLNSEVNLSPK